MQHVNKVDAAGTPGAKVSLLPGEPGQVGYVKGFVIILRVLSQRRGGDYVMCVLKISLWLL